MAAVATGRARPCVTCRGALQACTASRDPPCGAVVRDGRPHICTQFCGTLLGHLLHKSNTDRARRKSRDGCCRTDADFEGVSDPRRPWGDARSSAGGVAHALLVATSGRRWRRQRAPPMGTAWFFSAARIHQPYQRLAAASSGRRRVPIDGVRALFAFHQQGTTLFAGRPRGRPVSSSS